MKENGYLGSGKYTLLNRSKTIMKLKSETIFSKFHISNKNKKEKQ